MLGERLRPDARETVEFFLREGVQLKVISGDAPETVAAIAADAGIPTSGPPLDGRDLPDRSGRAAAGSCSRRRVIGRISPEGKRRVVEALTDAGHYVAMVGDGVNDVPALKAARLAIAQGSGSQMAKSVADIVLVRGDFARRSADGRRGPEGASQPPAGGEAVRRRSRRSPSCSILTLGLVPQDYPVLPRHLTLAAALTIGIPAFFLALAPSSGAWRTPTLPARGRAIRDSGRNGGRARRGLVATCSR